MVPVTITLNCAETFKPKARYVLDTLLSTHRVPVEYEDLGNLRETPTHHAIYYGPLSDAPNDERCLRIFHDADYGAFFKREAVADEPRRVQGLPILVGQAAPAFTNDRDIGFDLIANAFYFLSSWPERILDKSRGGPTHFPESVFSSLGIPQDIVDQYLALLVQRLNRLASAADRPAYQPLRWNGNKRFAVVLSHDVDFIPSTTGDVLKKGAQSLLRSVVRHQSPLDACRVSGAFLRNIDRRENPYRRIPHMIARERARNVRASYQIAVARHHPNDVNYSVDDPGVVRYLRTIQDNGFEICLHGSYLSTEIPGAYEQEAARIRECFGEVTGSRQHYLSFRQETLFRAQERAGIQFDMSLGYADQIGFRSGFSFPFFPYCFDEDRPYNVLQISLFLMDVTLRGYMGFGPDEALKRIQEQLGALARTGGCGSVVWHPILFGDARDPGYGPLFWKLIDEVEDRNGLATDGATVNAFWRGQMEGYTSFSPQTEMQSTA